MNIAMIDGHLPGPPRTDRSWGWTGFALMLCAAVSVVVLGAIPLLRLLPIH